MSKKQAKSVDELIQNIDLNVLAGDTVTSTNSLKGKSISLNQKSASVFGVGSIWLTTKNYSTVIPDTVSIEDETIIKSALNKGTLVEGNVQILPLERDQNVLLDYWNLIKTYGLEPANQNSKSIVKFRKLLRDGVDSNWTAKEIAKFCIDKEKAYKNRDKVLKLLNDFYKNCDCPESLIEDTQ